MQLSERKVNGLTVIDVAGELAKDESSGLKEFVTTVLDRGERRIVLNVARLGIVDSTCLGEIFASYKTAAAVGGVLKLAQADAHLRRLLHVTKLNTFIQVHDTEADAVASFGETGIRAS